MRLYSSIAEVRHALLSGQFSLPELVSLYLNRINQHAHLNAFIEVWPEEAVYRAEQIQQKLNNGTAGKLAGAVIGIKDNLLWKGHLSTSGSRILQGHVAAYTATALQRLLDEDALFIGRLNCDEFSMGSSGETSAYGPSRNPHQMERTPGGSSGGAAAAVAAQLCHAAIGSDTGGSIRQPAAFCGVVGFKPSYGSVSRYGLIAYGSSFDAVGPITQCVDDAHLIWETMQGADAHDATALGSTQVENAAAKLRVAVLRECFNHPSLSPIIRRKMVEVIEAMRQDGYEVEEVDLPMLSLIVPTYYILTTAEASSNLSRFDGVRFGQRASGVTDWDELYAKTRSEGFGPEVKRRILLGTFVLSSGYYDAYFTKAQRARTALKLATDAIFKHYDVVMSPVTTSEAFALGSHDKDPVAMYMEDIFTVHANLVGAAAIALPAGSMDSGLPFGIQWMAAQGNDRSLLDFSRHVSKHLSPAFTID